MKIKFEFSSPFSIRNRQGLSAYYLLRTLPFSLLSTLFQNYNGGNGLSTAFLILNEFIPNSTFFESSNNSTSILAN